ncbi:MAG: aldehyde dehydrogenase family protein [Pseudomonadota bacterium]
MGPAEIDIPSDLPCLAHAYVGGEWIGLPTDNVSILVDPSSEAPAGRLVCADRSIVDRAVAAARSTFASSWSSVSVGSRIAVLEALAERITTRREAFARCISEEIGAPIDFAREAQVDAAVGHLGATISALRDHLEDVPLSEDRRHRVRYEPVGVAALITPWNWPLNQVVLKVAGAIAAGCTMVLKPSELSTRTALLLAREIAETGLPAGVFNLLPGDGETGAALAAHPGVDHVSFTGSTEVGRSIAQSAAARFASTTLELGGKSANLLFEDCDLETAVRQGVAHCFRNAGQSCNAASRMLVARPIYEQCAALVTEAVSTFQVGPPDRAGRHIGPLVSAAQFERVQGFLQAGLDEGARCLAGGLGRPEELAHGFYARPTAFADVTPQMSVFREEIFGPVLTLTPFDRDDEAIDLADATPYGLAGYIQTADAERADRVAQRLSAGMIQINGSSRVAGAPFGGVKASGMGRESGIWGIRAFQYVKSISGARMASERIG